MTCLIIRATILRLRMLRDHNGYNGFFELFTNIPKIPKHIHEPLI